MKKSTPRQRESKARRDYLKLKGIQIKKMTNGNSGFTYLGHSVELENGGSGYGWVNYINGEEYQSNYESRISAAYWAVKEVEYMSENVDESSTKTPTLSDIYESKKNDYTG